MHSVSQKGMAVIMALLVVALAAAASTLVLWQQGLWWRQLQQDRDRAEIHIVVNAGIEWVMAILRFSRMSSPVVYPGQLWAQPLPETSSDGVMVKGELADMQGRFNLNALGNKDGTRDGLRVRQYMQLLSALRLPTTLAESLMKVMQLKLAPTNKADQDKPMVAPSVRWLERIDELRWVEGYTPEVIAQLTPYIAVLPPGENRINVNTAPTLLLKALLPDVNSGRLDALLQQRVSIFFKDAADFEAKVRPATEHSQIREWVRTDSAWFLLNSEVSKDTMRLVTHALIRIENGPLGAKLIWRQDGITRLVPLGES